MGSVVGSSVIVGSVVGSVVGATVVVGASVVVWVVVYRVVDSLGLGGLEASEMIKLTTATSNKTANTLTTALTVIHRLGGSCHCSSCSSRSKSDMELFLSMYCDRSARGRIGIKSQSQLFYTVLQKKTRPNLRKMRCLTIFENMDIVDRFRADADTFILKKYNWNDVADETYKVYKNRQF